MTPFAIFRLSLKQWAPSRRCCNTPSSNRRARRRSKQTAARSTPAWCNSMSSRVGALEQQMMDQQQARTNEILSGWAKDKPIIERVR